MAIEARIAASEADSLAVKGENEPKITIAQSDALRREKEAEASKLAMIAEKVPAAKALEESYVAEQRAEEARADTERGTQNANIVIPAEIAKQKQIIEAEADAEKIRLNAQGEADAIFAKMDAEAKGLYEILTKQVQGYDKIVQAAGGDTNSAFQLLLIDDNITACDGGNSTDGSTSTANFVSGMMKSVPPLNDLFNMAGLNLPTYLKDEEPKEATIIKKEKKFYTSKPTYQFEEDKTEKKDDESPDDSVKE